MDTKEHIAIVGLGYVGLPLALNFAAHYPTIGYDCDPTRIEVLLSGTDQNNECQEALAQTKNLQLSCELNAISMCNVYIIAVPTPLKQGTPNLSLLERACTNVSSLLKAGDLVVIESTVYPGATEEFCIPILESGSGLSAKKDFGCGYSPERVRPSSKWSDPVKIVKLTSGYTEEAAKRVDTIYGAIIKAGTLRVSNMKVAEMSKLVENIQRDVNIALSNEVAMACHVLGIQSNDVLTAAESKWDFKRFDPGLVGGHCISVDPVYFTSRMHALGFKSRLVELAREVNDQMAAYIVSNWHQLLKTNGLDPRHTRVLIMGFGFKENCNDFRNTLVYDIANQIKAKTSKLCVCDPVCDVASVKTHYDIELKTNPHEVLKNTWDVIIFAVKHDEFKQLDEALFGNALIMDVKNVVKRADWRL